MPFLTLDDGTDQVTVEVTVRRGANRAPDIGGSIKRAFGGAPRQSVRWRKSRWPVRTIPIPLATKAADLRAVLEATPPLTATGDLVGASTEVFIDPESIDEGDYQKLDDGSGLVLHAVLEFTMWEA